MAEILKKTAELSSFLLRIAISCGSYEAHGTALIPPGIHAKASAGAGQTVSRGPTALFYNPANLIFSKRFEPSLDVGFSKVDYTYTHANANSYPDPVGISSPVPSITAGASIRLIPNFAFGVAMTPKILGSEVVVEGVPLNEPAISNPDGEALDFFAAESGFNIVAGAAYRIFSPLTIGLGLHYDNSTSKQYQLALPEAPPFLEMATSGSAIQFMAGLRSEVFDRHTVIAFSVKTPAEKKMQGDYILLNIQESSTKGSDPIAAESVEYLPLTIGFGVETKISSFGLFFDFVREQWSNGGTVARLGLDSDPDAIDYIDTNNFSIGGKVWLKESHMLTASFGMHGPNVGDGTEISTQGNSQEEDSGSPIVAGMSFGNTQGISRMIFAGGYRYRLFGRGYLELAGQFQKGERVVPEGFAQEGLHSLSVLVASAGLGFGF